MRRMLLKGSLFSHISKTGASVAVGIAFLSSSPLTAAQLGGSSAPASDWKQVEDAMGRPGQMQPGDVIKFRMPRKDLHVTLDGVDIKPGLALASWEALKRDGDGAMVMSDLVLTEDEVEPVMKKLQEGASPVSYALLDK